jgi:uncharacterized membrane protein YiaA
VSRVIFYGGFAVFLVGAMILQPEHSHLAFWLRLVLVGLFCMATAAWHRANGR